METQPHKWALREGGQGREKESKSESTSESSWRDEDLFAQEAWGQENRMEKGVWTLILVPGLAGLFLCFAEETGLESGSLQLPQIGQPVNKTLFFPHQLLCNAHVWWQTAESQFGNSMSALERSPAALTNCLALQRPPERP